MYNILPLEIKNSNSIAYKKMTRNYMIYIPTILFYCAYVNHCGHLSPTKCLFLLIIDSFGDATNKLQHILNSSDSESNNVDRLGRGKI